MLTSSPAERSTQCADYEIGLQLEPQEVHPSVRYGARRTRHPGHTGFGQTWSATKGAMNNIDYSTVQIAPAEAVRRRKLAWHGLAVESIEVPGHRRIEYRFHASVNMLAMYDQGTVVAARLRSTECRHRRSGTSQENSRWCRPVTISGDLHEESTLTRMMYFYFDPIALQMPSDARVSEMIPRPLFDDFDALATALS